MTQSFKISAWTILKGLLIPIILVGFFFVIHLIEYYNGEFDFEYTGISLIFIAIFSFPSIVLLFDHLFNNYNSILRLDAKNKLIEIEKPNGVKKYNENQLLKATLITTLDNLLLYRVTLFWSVFGYLRLEFKDGEIYYFSTLTFNKNKIWIWNLSFIQVFFPLIQSSLNHDAFYKNTPNRIKYYKNKYKAYSLLQLNDIIENSEKYQVAAIEACRLIIQERNSATKEI